MLPTSVRRVLAALLVAGAALPTAAHAADTLTLSDRTERIGPGITLRHFVQLQQIGWTDAQVLTVDLQGDGVKADLLTAGKVAAGGPLTASAKAAGAVAGVNGDFFDINNSNAAIGPEIQAGQVLKSGAGSAQVAGVTPDGLGRLANLTLDATVDLPSGTKVVKGLNDPTSPGAGTIVAYTPAWGAYSRRRGLDTATDVAEAIVVGGKVASVGLPGSGQLADDAFALDGREAGAAAIRALNAGDGVALHYALKSDVADQLAFAVGGRQILVKNGVPQPESVVGTDGNAPRTAIGFKDGGKTMLLAIADGRQSLVLGPTRAQMGELMAALGADTALNLDGGGSTTLVARPLGGLDATVRNVPSDGSERADPNGVGLFLRPGDGTLHSLAISAQDRVFPGLHRALDARGLDDRDAPVAAGSVTWSASSGSIDGAALKAPDSGTVTVSGRGGAAEGSAQVRVLGATRALEPSAARLSFAETGSAASVLRLNGRDDDGYTAPIDPSDIALDYDRAVLSILPAADGGLRIVPTANGATIVTLRAAGLTARVPVTVGFQTRLVSGFDDGGLWSFRNDRSPTGAISIVDGGHTGKAMKVDYDFTASTATRSAGAVLKQQITLPGQPLRAGVWVKGDGQGQWVTISLRDAANKTIDLRPGYATGTGWQKFSADLPTSGVQYPVRVDDVRLIETAATKLYKGSFLLDDLEIDVPSAIDAPAAAPLQADRLISPDGKLSGAWSFAALSDVQFTAAQPELTKVAIAALKRIRATRPDFVVLNGDIVDTGYPEDVALAKATLQAGGCDLVKAGEQPDPGPDQVPCYYVPGNHESYGTDNLDAWKAQFGTPYRTFDHAGVRFVLLNSTRGTLRGSDWAQLPMLQDALDTAASDPSVKDVVVFAHHPTHDPDPTEASQLGDRNEAALLERLLTRFTESSGKGAAMAGSHAQIVDVRRVDGVPYMVLPSSGKSPYGTPDRGGFTGWVRFGVDPGASDRWLRADVRAFAQSATIDAPDTLVTGATGAISGSIVQPSGVQPGTRVVPLRYPMSVHWGGSGNLAIGKAADTTGKVAVLDPVAGTITGLRSGQVTVAVANESMRDGDDLAPVTASKTIVVGVPGTVGGTVAPTLSLSVGGAASFGAFTPGIDQLYSASTTATVTSTAGDATLTASAATLANGAFRLAEPVAVDLGKAAWTGPVSNDGFAIGFRQHIGANEPLRTGGYSATLTFTLSTTAP
jgi:hypothetical protein